MKQDPFLKSPARVGSHLRPATPGEARREGAWPSRGPAGRPAPAPRLRRARRPPRSARREVRGSREAASEASAPVLSGASARGTGAPGERGFKSELREP